MSRRSQRTLAVAALSAALILPGCGGSGITATEIGLEIEPLADVRLAKEIREIGQGSPPYGATVNRVLKTEHVDGVWVAGTERGSPAADAGLGPGDLITAVNGERVTTPAEVDEALDDADAGSGVEIDGLYVASGDATQFLKAWSAEVKLPGD
jgi:S1-C subfamily serine protease